MVFQHLCLGIKSGEEMEVSSGLRLLKMGIGISWAAPAANQRVAWHYHQHHLLTIIRRSLRL
jgi:hypothetical protein